MTQLPLKREQAFEAINSERDYQDVKWGPKVHTIQEWLTYIRDYTEEALHMGCREADETAIPKQLDIIRKIAGMGTACMEQHGAPRR